MFDKGHDELKLREEWMKEARDMTVEKLPAFIDKLVKFNHDYGTICRAISAAGVAAAYAIEHSPVGGITGFQAGCVKWDLLTGWDKFMEGKPLRIVDYEDMIFPQHEERFRSISSETWEHVQKKAKESLNENHQMHPNVSAHMQSIVDGVVPFGYVIRD